MLSDPLVVPYPTGGIDVVNGSIGDYLQGLYHPSGDHVILRTVDIAPGSGTRKGALADGTKVSMRVQHSTSKENAPYITDRTLVRLDFTKLDGTGKPVTSSVYMVTALPQGGTFTETQFVEQAQALATFTLIGAERAGAGAPRFYDANSSDTLKRLLAGEA